MPQRAGWPFRIVIAGSNFKAKQVRVVDKVTGLDVTNSEGQPGSALGTVGVGYGAKIGSVKDAVITVTAATFDDTDNAFSAPYSLQAGLITGPLLVLPVQGLARQWSFPAVLITELTYEAEVRGLQPITFTAESDGRYTPPS